MKHPLHPVASCYRANAFASLGFLVISVIDQFMYNRINHWDETLHLLRGDSLHLISALKSKIMNYYAINYSFDLTLLGREMVVKFTLQVKELLKLIFWIFPVAAAGSYQ